MCSAMVKQLSGSSAVTIPIILGADFLASPIKSLAGPTALQGQRYGAWRLRGFEPRLITQKLILL